MSEKGYFYYCPTCEINFATLKCPDCGKKGVQATVKYERDWSKDPSYFNYVLKKGQE